MSRFGRKKSKSKQKKAPIKLVREDPIVAICIPSDDMVDAPFCLALVHMLMHTLLQDEVPIRGLTIQHVGASILPHSRYTLVKQAQAHESTHMLFLDSDMTFPADTLVRMLKHDRDMVGVNAMSRRPPYNTTAWAGPDHRIETTQESTGLEKAWRTGLAVALIKAKVFEQMDAPYFDLEYLPEKDQFRGEDYVFFDRARAAGFELWIDHDVSKQVNHIGLFAYNPLLKVADGAPGVVEEARRAQG